MFQVDMTVINVCDTLQAEVPHYFEHHLLQKTERHGNKVDDLLEIV